MSDLRRIFVLCNLLKKAPLLAVLAAVSASFAQPASQITREQEQLDREHRALQKDNADVEQAARKAYERSFKRVIDWYKGQVADALEGALAVSDPVLLMQRLVSENIEVYKEALRGDWTSYKQLLRESALRGLGHYSPVDPTVVEQLFDIADVAILRQRIKKNDDRAANLLQRQAVVDDKVRRQVKSKSIITTHTPTVDPLHPTSPPKSRNNDWTPLDRAVGELEKNDRRNRDEFTGAPPDRASIFGTSTILLSPRHVPRFNWISANRRT